MKNKINFKILYALFVAFIITSSSVVMYKNGAAKLQIAGSVQDSTDRKQKNAEVMSDSSFIELSTKKLINESNEPDRSMQSGFNSNMVVTGTLVSTATGCYMKIVYKDTWSGIGNTNDEQFPRGIRIEADGNPTSIGTPVIVSISPASGWVTSPSTNTSTLTGPGYNFYNFNASQYIASNTTITIHVPILASSGLNGIKVIEINAYNTVPTSTGFPTWSNGEYIPFTQLPATFVIQPDASSICTGTSTTVRFTIPSTLPAGATVTWYTAPAPCPMTVPPMGWTQASNLWTGGADWPTNNLTASRCYVAIVKVGCFFYTTNVVSVEVCSPPPNLNITAVPISPYGSLALGNRYCKEWSGTLSLLPSVLTCKGTTIVWKKNGVTVNAPTPGLSISTGVLTATQCNTPYNFQAIITNSCGTFTANFNIIIDAETAVGTLVALDVGSGTPTAPVLCYNDDTRLKYTKICGDVIKWEYNTGSGFVTLPNAGLTELYFTNGLTTTTTFRVWVQNGACPPKSVSIVVTVKPQLAVTISASALNLCQSPVTLTATSNVNPVNYQWYLNGVAVNGVMSQTYQATVEGNYSVKVTDPACGSAWSSVITLCPPPKVFVLGPSCFCKGTTVTLTGKVEPVLCYNCTYSWTGPNGFTSSSQSINVGVAGNYQLTVSCGAGCTRTIIHKLTQCP